MATVGDVGMQEAARCFFVAMIGQDRVANADGDGQYHDVVLLDEILRQVARRIHHDTNAHEAPPGVHRKLRPAT
jgi:hypothetical protein